MIIKPDDPWMSRQRIAIILITLSFITISAWVGQEQLNDLFSMRGLARITAIIAGPLFIYCNLIFIANLTQNNMKNFSWFFKDLQILMSSKLWDEKLWKRSFFPIQLLNAFLSLISPEKYLIWLLSIPIVFFGWNVNNCTS